MVDLRYRDDAGDPVIKHKGLAIDGDDGRACHGTLLSRQQYLVDVDHWGYRDARLGPEGTMTEADVAIWTAAIEGR